MKRSRFICMLMALAIVGAFFPLTASAVTDDANNLIIGPGETYTLGGVKTYAVGIQVAATGILYVDTYTGAANTGWLELHAPTVTIAGTINGDGRGYRGSYAATGEGPGGGPYPGGGGAYGGNGGASGWGNPGGTAYGTGNGSDIQMGSGGGGQGTSTGGNGGATVSVVAINTLNVSGTITVKGSQGQDVSGGMNDGGGGGAGGGIYLNSRIATISGTLSANGGRGGNSASRRGGGGGGGGRVKIFYCSLTNSATITVNGGALGTGSGGNGQAGGVGTTYTHLVTEADITSIVDVRNDQGRFVRMTWAGACSDNGSDKLIVKYTIWRRIDALPAPMSATRSAQPMRVLAYPPGSWDYVTEVPARGETSYNTVVPTLADSNSTGVHYSVFFISAVTADPYVFYDSAPDSGYSVDNLPPVSPAPFTGAYAAGATHLHWGENTEPDVWYYAVYRGSSADFVPAPANLIATQADTGYTDVGPAGSYYKLSAVDVNGNESAYALLTASGTVAVEDGEALSFALGTVRPNPTRGDRLSVEFVLARAGAARLELLDVAGRLVIGREVGALGIGRHQVDLAARARLTPGLYLVRLTQGAAVRVGRVVIID